MAARPTLLLYDEATTGLDPMTALTVDAEVVKLRDLERVTSVLVTHQLRDAFYVATHEAQRTAGGEIELVEAAEAEDRRSRFRDDPRGPGRFRGHGRRSCVTRQDPYLQTFLS